VADATRGQGVDELELVISSRSAAGRDATRAEPARSVDEDGRDALSIDERSSYYVATDPLYTFDTLVLPAETLERLMLAVETVQLRSLVFGTWNLRSIQPHPSAAINLHGNPGTGKTLAAHAIAHKLNQKIICSKHSQLESKYHGEGPKNLDALFKAAEAQNAVLFLDEADSLMSRRFESVSQGAEQAVNSMRSELLMCLDKFEGIVIFATNFVQSYDDAFDSRVRHVEIPDPDFAARSEIWRRHLPVELPIGSDVSVEGLAGIEAVSGREIRQAVIDAAVKVAREQRGAVLHKDLVDAVETVKVSRLAAKRSATPQEVGDGLADSIVTAAADVPFAS
jgi:ATP-dependent 26S proteasome regulatory subunit